MNTGSAVDVRSSASELGELDALTLRSNAARTAYGYQTQAQTFGEESTLDTAAATGAETGGFLSGGASLLSGAGSALGNYLKFQASGLLNPSQNNPLTAGAVPQVT